MNYPISKNKLNIAKKFLRIV